MKRIYEIILSFFKMFKTDMIKYNGKKESFQITYLTTPMSSHKYVEWCKPRTINELKIQRRYFSRGSNPHTISKSKLV